MEVSLLTTPLTITVRPGAGTMTQALPHSGLQVMGPVPIYRLMAADITSDRKRRNVTLIENFPPLTLPNTSQAPIHPCDIGERCAGDIGTAAGTILSDTELDNITTSGTLTIGEATTKGTDGAGASASTLTAGAITLDELTLVSQD
ncbi:MAG: hypothetical protein RNU03_11930 [Candidatus Sedimenticola sp. (ex Thyasira tokunagai)]